MSEAPLWRPSPERARATRLDAFRRDVEARAGRSLPDSTALHAWSVDDRASFWTAVWELCGVVGDRGERALVDGDRMPGSRWFPDARLNFAENLLAHPGDGLALIHRDEHGHRVTRSWRELRDEVSRLAAAMRAAGVEAGDRVAGFLPNGPAAVSAMLASASLGAVWSSCSPDFGTRGVLDRFGQIEPKLLFAVDGYPYGGKWHETRGRVDEIRNGLPSVERTVLVARLGSPPPESGERIAWQDFIEPHGPEPLRFERLPFDHPLYVLYSSGTTGAPKCIVHGAGGTLLQHLKEHQLHADLQPDDRMLYFTTTGWMMWNWLVSSLASGACAVLYDGSPFHPAPDALFALAEEERLAVLGVSAKFIDAVRKRDLRPRDDFDLSGLRTILSTGSPLAPEGFDYIYEAVHPDVQLSSISGGTDIISCFVGGDPTGPVWRGECQMAGLGMDVDVFDEDGHPLRGEPGELVCKRSFPSMPVGFWNDPDGARYRAAYFERFPDVWCHGDFAEITAHGGVVIHGRSDATLNPGGVRIGTAEIYRQVEQLEEILESLVIGQAWDGDTRVVLFVRLRDGLALDDDLRERIRRQVRTHASPRHVPARIVQVDDIPRTRSGKIVELAVREVVHGRPVKNREALANPEALDLFRGHPELGD